MVYNNGAEIDTKFTYFFSMSTSASVDPHEKVPLLMTIASTGRIGKQHTKSLISRSGLDEHFYFLTFQNITNRKVYL